MVQIRFIDLGALGEREIKRKSQPPRSGFIRASPRRLLMTA